MITGKWNRFEEQKNSRNIILNMYETFNKLSKGIVEYIYVYDNRRYKEGLNGLRPSEFGAKAAYNHFYYFQFLIDREPFVI